MDEKQFARLGKMVELARNGVGGEKENAIRKVKEICKSNDLDFEDVIKGGEKIEAFSIWYKNKTEERILVQTILKYGDPVDDSLWNSRRKKQNIIFETTKAKYIEALVAWDVIKKAFREESDIFILAFVHKHRLFSTKKGGGNGKSPSEEEALRMFGMASSMKDVEIAKRLN